MTRSLASVAELMPVCPEVESGLGTPREPMSLHWEEGGELLLLGQRTGVDYAPRLDDWACRRAEALAREELDGFILKSKSPSCGLRRVKIRGLDSSSARTGSGIFAKSLSTRLPWLTLAEEGWLNDAGLRESFLHGVFTHWRFREEVLSSPSVATLRDFHRRHKLLYMAHSPKSYVVLGRISASATKRALASVLATYRDEAMAALGTRTTPGKHANVLQHMLGHLSHALLQKEKAELLTAIDDYQRGLHRLEVPLSLLKHHILMHQPSAWLSDQVYLQPYPKTLASV